MTTLRIPLRDLRKATGAQLELLAGVCGQRPAPMRSDKPAGPKPRSRSINERKRTGRR